MNGGADFYVATRRALLDALDALAAQQDALVLVGAQAIYLHTGPGDLPIAPATKDTDIAIEPGRLVNDPTLEAAMTQAKFVRNLVSGQPGEWLTAEGIPVDLLVPETLSGEGGRRGARIAPHAKYAARRALGLEAAVVDNAPMRIESLAPDDPRAYTMAVATPAALLVAKLHKLGERQERPNRLLPKDAYDVYRLMREVAVEDFAAGFERLAADARSAEVTEQALTYLGELFADAAALGCRLAGRAEEGVGDPEQAALATALLAGDIRSAVAAASG